MGWEADEDHKMSATQNATAMEKVCAERDEARQIVRDIYWMALRYADGRKSYAVGMCNDAVQKGYDGGWLKPGEDDKTTPRLARDGMSPEWTRVEAATIDRCAAVAADYHDHPNEFAAFIGEEIARAIFKLKEPLEGSPDLAAIECLADAYRSALRMPLASVVRLRNQNVLSLLRRAVAAELAANEQTVQDAFELQVRGGQRPTPPPPMKAQRDK
jgi:hypothetical protein